MQQKVQKSNRQKKEQSGSEPMVVEEKVKRVEPVVCSIIEHTKYAPSLHLSPTHLSPTKETKEKISKGVDEYRADIHIRATKLYGDATLDNNLLSAKLALWEALQLVEKRMRENRQ